MKEPARYRALERLQQSTRATLPELVPAWNAPVREALEDLTTASLDPDLSDEDFEALVADTRENLHRLMDEIDHSALADLMEESMGASAANGIAARMEETPAVQAKLPWKAPSYLAGGKGKRCGNSWIPKWKQCGKNDGREWNPASADEAAMLQRLTGKDFRAGARVLATPEALRHTARGHAHQLAEKDWQQLRGRLFDRQTDRETVITKRDGAAIQFQFRRGDDLMEAVFSMHFPHKKSPGELHLKTFKKLDPRDLLRKKN